MLANLQPAATLSNPGLRLVCHLRLQSAADMLFNSSARAAVTRARQA